MKKQRPYLRIEEFAKQVKEFFKKREEEAYKILAIPKEGFNTGSLPKSAF